MDRANALRVADECLREAFDLLRDHNDEEGVAQSRLAIRRARWWLDRVRNLHKKKQPDRLYPLLEAIVNDGCANFLAASTPK